MLAVAEFMFPDFGDKVNPMPLTLSPQSGIMNTATVLPIKVDLGSKGPTPLSLLP